MFKILDQSGVAGRLGEDDFINGQAKLKSKRQKDTENIFFNLGRTAAGLQRDKLDNANALQQISLQRALLDVEKSKIQDMNNILTNKQAEFDGKLNALNTASMYPPLPQVAGASPFPTSPVAGGGSPYPPLPMVEGASPYPPLPMVEGASPYPPLPMVEGQTSRPQQGAKMPPPIY